jgi:hypothetical protein
MASGRVRVYLHILFERQVQGIRGSVLRRKCAGPAGLAGCARPILALEHGVKFLKRKTGGPAQADRQFCFQSNSQAAFSLCQASLL